MKASWRYRQGAILAALVLTVSYPGIARATDGASGTGGTSSTSGTMGTTGGTTEGTTGGAAAGNMNTNNMGSMSTDNTAMDSDTMSGGGTMTGSSWDSQSTYWRNNYPKRPYYSSSRDFSVYEPAYRYGVDLYSRHPGTPYESLDQAQLRSGWEQAHGNSDLSWNEAQKATRDAYERMYKNRNNMGNNTGTSPATGSQ